VGPKRTILVVDDEASARFALKRVFNREHNVVEVSSVEEARMALATELPDVVLLDYSMPGEDGLVLLREMRDVPFPPAVIMLTAHGSERVAVEAMRCGAYDYLSKPYDLEELRITVGRALERQELHSEVRSLRETLAHEGQFGRMIGSSPAMQELFETAARVAPTDLSIMLLGESGTGKDVLAQEIHARSPRSKWPFVAVNCTALPETLVETELFGCEKGAFTGAVQSRAGRFESANGGTLFLDEIGDMPTHLQPKILRAAEEGAVQRLGAGRPVHVDARLVCATNRDLQESIRAGEFREDLYYRLAGVVLRLPPLRDRRDDILLLAERFWEELGRKHDREGPVLSQEALLRLRAAPWPGNVRQLRNTMEKLFVLARGNTVRADDVVATLELDRAGPATGTDGPLATADFREARRQFETEYLRRKLEENGGNVTRTAAAIGIERQTLQEKIKKLGVVRD
jgi:DNA-binding NtrC family response regulator